MNHVLILCRSVTQAQRASQGLEDIGVTNRIFRSPVGLTDRGCSYSVKIYERELSRALIALAERGIRPLKIVCQTDRGDYAEVKLP